MQIKCDLSNLPIIATSINSLWRGIVLRLWSITYRWFQIRNILIIVVATIEKRLRAILALDIISIRIVDLGIAIIDWINCLGVHFRAEKYSESNI